MTNIGFTGTRIGMSISQWKMVEELQINLFEPNARHEWHDGDCVGADAQARSTAAKLKGVELREIEIHSHPCNLEKWRAFGEADYTHQIAPPLVRNRVIVRMTHILIAAPSSFEEQFKGSGTWATIRHARRLKKILYIVWPDGKVTEENVL